MDETSSTCRHTDVQVFDSFRCCLSCGSLVTDSASPAIPALPYEYKPLDCGDEQHIRLVHVHPGQRQDQIVCDLVHVNLAAVPVYEAVSYTWATTSGDASPSQSIICQGKELAITKNCEAALRCLRRPNHPRVLWIDAICIDQKSTTERNHQVRLMDAVYSNASQVLLYLSFRNPGTIAKFLDYLDKRSRGIITSNDKRSRGGVITGNSSIERSVCVDFLQHAYFNRVWVLQEISFAKLAILQTDYQSIHWDARTVWELTSLCISLNHDLPGVLNWLPATQRDEHNCLDLLNRARRCLATDPRDKVFALYSFLPACFREALPIDYATGVDQVYWNVATHLVSTTGRLDVLKHVPHYQPLDLDLMPSWVPDWDIRHFVDTDLPKFTAVQMKKFAAFDDSPVSIETSSNTVIQPTAAHTIHEEHGVQLSSRHDPVLWYRNQNTDHHFSVLGRVYAMRNSKIPCLRVRGYLLDKVTTHTCKMPSSDLSVDRSLHLPHLQHTSTSFLCSRVCRSCGDNEQRESCDEVPSETHLTHQWRRLSSMLAVMTNLRGEKRVFETQQSIGLILCTPIHDPSRPRRVRKVEPEDTIWAIEGLDVPVILRRKTQDGRAHYILIGTCYLHRAEPQQKCPICGSSIEPWSMEYATIDIW